jgi:putative PEP-CTERM system TPR-repeat lipoprotein
MKNSQHSHPLRAASVALAAALTLAACGRHDAASYVESAKAYAAKNDYKAAVIEAKNALQKDANSGEARLVLAQSLLATGDAAGAEAEVRKAIALGVPADKTMPMLAHALAAQGQFAKVESELGDQKLSTGAGRADLDAWVAIAALAQGKADKAKRLADAALADDPGNVRATLLLAQIAAGRGDSATAHATIETALAKDATNIDALLMLAQLDSGEGKRDAAIKTLDRAITAHPDSIPARYMRLAIAVTSGDLATGKAQLAKMKEIQAGELRTIYGEALVSFADANYAQARDAVQRVLAARPDDVATLYLSGLVDYQLGAYSSAEEALRKVVTRTPANVGARRALAVVYLRTGRGPQALETLAPALREAPDNPLLLRTVGEAYLASGDTTQAERAYEHANSLDKGNVASKVRLAEVRYAGGDTARAVDDLEQLAASDASNYQADLALFFAEMRQRHYDKALAATEAIEKKRPKSGLPWDLRGAVSLAKGDLKGARANFEKALEVEPEFFGAAYNLGILDLREGRPQAARERYERLLKTFPNSEQLLLAYAQVLAVTGGSTDEVRTALDRAVSNQPTSVRARVARIEFDLRRRDPKAALTAAQAAVSAVPDNPQLIGLVGATQAMSGDYNQAIGTLKRLSQLQPQNPVPLLQLAEAQAANKEFAAAVDSERKALALKPDLAQGWSLLARTYLAWGRPDAALEDARKLQKDEPKKAIGFALEGEIYAVQQKWQDAANEYREAFSRAPTPQIAARYYTLLETAGKAADAKAMAALFIEQHPADATLPTLLAERSLAKGDLDSAIPAYERVLKIDPDNVLALNNMGWMLTQKKDPKGLDYAEQAHRLAPFNPGVLDTLGYAYMHNGNAKRSVQVLRMATAMAPGQLEYQLHLGQALAAAGDKDAAREALTPLTRVEKAPKIRAEAEKVMSAL